MARRRKPANKKAAVPAPSAPTTDAGDVVLTRPHPVAIPSPPLSDSGILLAPTHKKFGKFRCLLGETASSSPSSSSDDQTTVVEDWGPAGVVAEEVIMSHDDVMIVEAIEKSEHLEPTFGKLSIVPSEKIEECTENTIDSMDSSQSTDMVQPIEISDIKLPPAADQATEVSQDSQGSIDGDSSSSQPATMECTELKEMKSEGTDTDTSSSSNALSSASSSAPMTRRRSSRIRNLQESQASTREPCVTTAASSPVEDSPNPPLPTLLPPQAPPPSSKPVKVKSRWRRSSELEMNSTPSTPTSGSPLPYASPPMALASPPRVEPPLLPADEERLRSYEAIKENEYLTERERNKETKRMVCDCFLSKEEIAKGEQGCGEDCLNRLLMIECGSRCPLGEKCANKRFQRREHCPLEIFRTEKKGFGLRTTAEVQTGDFLTEYVGEVLDPKEFRRRAKDYAKDKNRHYYFMALKSDAIIDATMKGNHSRFINHSCDPNAETQKWTVNGELRIGFFATKNISYGEEITFDYQFQRYGKEAQRCYCESANCRGWIGEDPEKEEKEEKSKSSRRGSEKKDKKRDKSRQKDSKDLVEDMDLEQEVEKLCSSGLKNRAHTLTLCRLMLRVEDRERRSQLLLMLRTAEPACRRLFLDYHGLKLIWSWSIDTENTVKSEVMDTLGQLPIPNKTLLQDSKILAVIERWARDTPEMSPETAEPVIPKAEMKDESMEGVEPPSIKEEETSEDSKSIVERRAEDAEMARKLLESWSGLKEVFRIPKKERIEQMKEHEREADRGYKQSLELNSKSRVDRYRGSNGGNGSSSSSSTSMGQSKRMRDNRDSPDSRKAQRMEERTERNIARLTKYERRQLFELRVEKEERQRREEQMWQQQQQHMHNGTPYMLDPNGVPCFWDPSSATWHPLAHFPPGHMPDQNGPPMQGGRPMVPPHMLHSPMNFNPNQPPIPFDPTRGEFGPMCPPTPQPWMPNVPIPAAAAPAPPPPLPIPPIPIPPLPPQWKAAYDTKGQPYYYHMRLRVPQWEPPPMVPQPPPPQDTSSSSSSEDSEDSDSEEEDEEEESGSSEEDAAQQEKRDELVVKQLRGQLQVEEEPEEEEESEDYETPKPEQPPESLDPTTIEPPTHPPEDEGMETEVAPKEEEVPKETRRREGLVTEIIISPRCEEEMADVNSRKMYKETKEKLRRQKEAALRKQRAAQIANRPPGSSKNGTSSSASGSSKSGRDRRRDKVKPKGEGGEEIAMIDPDSDAGRRIKEQFRLKMASVMVQCLNPFRKPDCRTARITCNEDFKHLARKLTHFVMLKELKHCRNVSELECNDNVKHKAKDFVRKYMAKFGAVYQKEVENP